MQQPDREEVHQTARRNPHLNWETFYQVTKDNPPWPRLVRAVSLLGSTGEALDLGCGGGRNTRYLLAQGFQVTAVDQDGMTARGKAKHWHVYHIIARQP